MKNIRRARKERRENDELDDELIAIQEVLLQGRCAPAPFFGAAPPPPFYGAGTPAPFYAVSPNSFFPGAPAPTTPYYGIPNWSTFSDACEAPPPKKRKYQKKK